MNISEIGSMVSTYGFPIVMCGVMAWYVKYQSDRWHEEINNITESHKAETDGLKTALENNTLALQKISDILGSKDNA